ncbi:Crp/Fnr family transcriptional regulator [Olsenella uli]|uniref:Crp/Fnr family transcriptional regulator n=1 Tax=Olsenella uli TaxID=133926 RepID=UPI00195E2A0B|nr:Crp/Fnr family transcriptional regulator [Olsenella uli]MBM6816603.1 Crp/Fnr family transcriptional regulator [Olsenella uli]
MDYRAFFRDAVKVDDEGLLDVLSQNATCRAFEKGDCLLRTGEVQSGVGFLVSGIVRSFSVDADGHDITDCILFTPGSALSPSVELEGPSSSTVEALADGEAVYLGNALIRELLETNLAANHLFIRVVSEAWHMHWETRRVVSQLRSRERYLWFLERYPGIVEKVPNRYVASLLGMTPVTLSRLRSDLRNEGMVR